VWLDHISFEVSNYKESVAFYTALLGWKPGTDEGSQSQCEIGDIGDIIIRRGGGGNRGAAPPTTPPARRAAMGHISFGITPFDPDQGQDRAREARVNGARRYRRQGRHSYVGLQELPHDDAERIRPADQRHDEVESRRLADAGGFFLFGYGSAQ
jgi:catechol 2,3-dioxygenase-like lactoylglutathione lyase family enzyme